MKGLVYLGNRLYLSGNVIVSVGWLVGWLVTGAPTFVIWHHSLIQSRDLAPLNNSVLVLVSSAKMKAFHEIANKVN